MASVCTKWLHSCNPGWFADLPAVRPMGSNAKESCALIPLKLQQRLAERKKKKTCFIYMRKKFWNGSDTLTLKLDLATGCIDSSQRFEIWELNVLSGSFQLRLPAVVLRLAGPPDLERPTCDGEHELQAWLLRLSEVVVLRGQNRALSWWIQL